MSKNFEIQCILCYCKCIALHFQLLHLVCLTDQWSTFYKTRMSCLSWQYILSSVINKKERETWKVECGGSKWKVYCTVYEKNMDITLRVYWCQNKCFCTFKIWFVKNSICIVFCHWFIWLLFNVCWSRFGVPHCATFWQGQLIWVEIFESSLKMWWRSAGDFDGSQILVTSEGFQGFSRRFLSFEILKP